MPRKPLDLPQEVGRRFIPAMQDYFAEDQHQRDSIAAHQLSILGQYQNPRDGKLRLSDVKGMSEAMRNTLDD